MFLALTVALAAALAPVVSQAYTLDPSFSEGFETAWADPPYANAGWENEWDMWWTARESTDQAHSGDCSLRHLDATCWGHTIGEYPVSQMHTIEDSIWLYVEETDPTFVGISRFAYTLICYGDYYWYSGGDPIGSPVVLAFCNYNGSVTDAEVWIQTDSKDGEGDTKNRVQHCQVPWNAWSEIRIVWHVEDGTYDLYVPDALGGAYAAAGIAVFGQTVVGLDMDRRLEHHDKWDPPDFIYVDDLSIEGQSGAGPGDVDGNGVVDGLDLTAVLTAWETVPGDPLWNPDADLDDNNVVNGLDLTEVISNWTTATAEPEPAAANVNRGKGNAKGKKK